MAGLVAFGPAIAGTGLALSPRVADLTAGLFCAPPEGDRRPAPGTMAGWIHVPDQPVEMIAQGQVAPAAIGMGFGVRYALIDTLDVPVRYTVTHPPMPPANTTSQSWDSVVRAGHVDTAFFQFDIPSELQPGDWSFSATIDGEQVFLVEFTVHPASALPDLVGLCQGGALLSFSPAGRGATG